MKTIVSHRDGFVVECSPLEYRGSIPGWDRPKSFKQVRTNSSIAIGFTTDVSGSIMKFPLLKTDGGKSVDAFVFLL